MIIVQLRIKLVFFLLVVGSAVLAQQPQWFVKNTTDVNSKLIDFRSVNGPTLTTPSPLMPTPNAWLYENKEGDNAIYDENGDLEIFIAHNQVFDVAGNQIFDLLDHTYNFFNDFWNNPYLYDQDLAIVQVPYSCSKHYIIRYSRDKLISEIHYYIYDIDTDEFLDLNGNPYQVNLVPGNLLYNSGQFVNPGENAVRNLSVSKINDNGERFLYFEDDQLIHKMTIDQFGINYNGIFHTKLDPGGDHIHEAEIIKRSNGHFMYATTSGTNAGSFIEILEIDNSGNLINSNAIAIEGEIKGLEFSTDGNYLYLTRNIYPHLEYIEIQNSNIITPLALQSINNRSSYSLASIEIAHDGKMYFAGENGMSSVANPNDPNSLWTNLDIPLIVSGYTGNYANLRPLPNQIDGELLYTPITLPSTVLGCGNSFPEICAEDYLGFQYEWFVSNGQQMVTTNETTHCFTPIMFGKYALKVIDENLCTKWHHFKVQNDLPEIPPISSYYYCSLNEEHPPLVGWESNPLEGYFGFYTIAWTFEGNPVTGVGISYEIPYQGDGTYTATVIGPCGSQTFTFTVQDQLMVEVTANIYAQYTGPHQIGNVDYAGFTAITGTIPYTSYNITITDGTNTTVFSNQDAYFQYVEHSGVLLTITLELINKKECKIYKNTTTWSDGPGKIGEIGIAASPNPTNGNTTLYIENFDPEKTYYLEVLRMDGRSLLSQKIQTESTHVNLSRFEQGIYPIQVTSETESSSILIIKE